MMGVQKLAERQLFLMKSETLEKRVRAYYTETRDVDALIEYGVAILVRNFFCMGAFAELIQDLIQEAYLSAEPTAVMRQYLPYFENYFTADQWKIVIKRLFNGHSSYLTQTKEARLNSGYLAQEGTLENRVEGLVYRVEAIFEDSIGKKHKLTIRETDSTFDEAQTIQVLTILTTLSIFDTADARKYATYVSYQTSGKVIATAHNSRKKTKTVLDEEKTVAAKQAPQQEKAPKKTVTATDKKLPSQPLTPTRTEEASTVDKTTAAKKKESSSANRPENSNTTGRPPANTEPKKQAAASKVNERLQQRDTSYKRLGKSKEQIQNKREGKKKKHIVDSVLGRKKDRKRNKRK